MLDASQLLADKSNTPAMQNPGIAYCWAAAVKAYKRVKANHKSSDEAESAADKAFLDALPPIDSPENIRDFIACVAYGLQVNVFLPETGARLLWAAQVARTAVSLGNSPQPSGEKTSQ